MHLEAVLILCLNLIAISLQRYNLIIAEMFHNIFILPSKIATLFEDDYPDLMKHTLVINGNSYWFSYQNFNARKPLACLFHIFSMLSFSYLLTTFLKPMSLDCFTQIFYRWKLEESVPCDLLNKWNGWRIIREKHGTVKKIFLNSM